MNLFTIFFLIQTFHRYPDRYCWKFKTKLQTWYWIFIFHIHRSVTVKWNTRNFRIMFPAVVVVDISNSKKSYWSKNRPLRQSYKIVIFLAIFSHKITNYGIFSKKPGKKISQREITLSWSPRLFVSFGRHFRWRKTEPKLHTKMAR